MKKFITLILLGLFVLNSCRETRQPEQVQPPKTQTAESSKLLFVIKTDRGDMKGELYPDAAPNTVLNFVTLARSGFYKNITFHRVVPGFVIQGGDPKGDGTGGPGYSIPGEFDPAKFNVKPHLLGSLGMARTDDPDSAGSQFYICIGDCSRLNGRYTVFGKVTEGIQVALSIQVGDKIDDVEIIGNLPPKLIGKEIQKTKKKTTN